MEPVLIVSVSAPVASFRRPLDHNYQRTLPLPPPTTLLGIAGAALGLPDRELWDPQAGWSDLRVSTWMDEPPGKARDMWTVLKIISGKLGERSPYFRELLFYVRYKLAYGGTTSQLEELARAFRDPVFPLSLGRDDELMFVEDVTLCHAGAGDSVFGGTVLPCDIRKIPRLKPALAPGTAFEPPLVERLPVSFEVDKKGVRHPQKLQFFSFLPPGVQIEVPNLAPLQCAGQNFVWLNSSPNQIPS